MIKKNEIKQYNLRQINLIEKMIEDYLNHKISIILLIDNLHALIYLINEPPQYFVDTFIQYWSDLEIPYACAVADNKKSFTPEQINRINNGIKNIQKLISEYKKEFLSGLEDEISS